MIWVPLALMVAIYILADNRIADRAGAGQAPFALAAAFAGSALWFLAALFMTVDLLAIANSTSAALSGVVEANSQLVMPVMMVAGLALAFGGLAAAANRMVRADPDGPMVNVGSEMMIAGAGIVILLAAVLGQH